MLLVETQRYNFYVGESDNMYQDYRWFTLYPLSQRINSREMPVCTKRHITRLFAETLFVIAKVWENPTCPFITDWLKKLLQPENGVLCTTKKG